MNFFNFCGYLDEVFSNEDLNYIEMDVFITGGKNTFVVITREEWEDIKISLF